MTRRAYKLLFNLGDLRATRRGPGALVRRQARKEAQRGLARVLRR